MRLIDADLMIANGFKDKTIEVRTEDIIKSHEKVVKLLFRDVVDFINKQPTVDAVERKRGKWVLHPEVRNIYGGIYIECSECHTKYVVQYVEDEKYCRNCGAEMERGEANEMLSELY